MNLWERLRDGLRKTRERVTEGLGDLLGRRGAVDAADRERLTDALLAADVGPAATERLIARAEARMAREPELELREALERSAAEGLGRARARFEPEPGSPKPWVALLVGVNGV